MTDPLSNSLKGLVGGAAVLFVGNAIGMGSSFLTRVVAARYLGPSDYGLIVLGVTFLTVATPLVLLGMNSGLAQRLPRRDDVSDLFVRVLVLTVPLSLVVSTVAFSASGFLSSLFGTPEFAPILRIFTVALPFMVLLEVLVGGFRGLEAASYRVVTKDVLFKGLLILAIVIGAYAGVDPSGIASTWVLSLAVAVTGAVYLAVRKTSLLPSAVGLRDINLQSTYSFAAFTLPLMVSGTSWLMMNHVDNAILGYFLSPNDVGIYDAAYSFATVLMVITSTADFLFLPIFSRLDAEGKRWEMGRFYETVAKWMTFLALPLFSLLVLYPRVIMAWVYGPEYASGATSLAIVALGMFVMLVVGHAHSGILALGESRLVLRGNVFALLVNLSLNVLLIPMLGIDGAAVATLASYVTVSLFFGYHLFAKTGINSLSPSLVRPVLVAGLLFAAGSLVFKYLLADGAIPILLSVALVVPYVGLLVRSGGIDSAEVELLVTLGDEHGVNVNRMTEVLDRYS